RLLEAFLAALADVDVVVERAADLRRIAAFLARHPGDARELRAELLGRQLVGHPAVGESRHATEASLDDRIGGAGAALPGETRRVRRDPDRDGILHRARLDREALERVEPAVMRDLRLVKQAPQHDDAFLEPSDALARRDAHDGVLERLRRVRLV